MSGATWTAWARWSAPGDLVVEVWRPGRGAADWTIEWGCPDPGQLVVVAQRQLVADGWQVTAEWIRDGDAWRAPVDRVSQR